jgi:LysM repeat protein
MPVKHTVRPGECLSKIAAQYGFGDYKVIYNHPDNAALKRARPNPNVIHPGDQIIIPDPTAKSVTVAAGQAHVIRVKRPRKELRIAVKDHEGKPLKNEPYVLEIDGVTPAAGQSTDGDGMVKVPVPLHPPSAKLTIKGRVMKLVLGGLDPIAGAPDAGISGMQARLKNLGYCVGVPSGKLDRGTALALALFQADAQLEATGEPDEATLTKLVEKHGS